jgi:predicted site-specific integrase-resolvase
MGTICTNSSGVIMFVNIKADYVPAKEVRKIIHVSNETLQNWAKAGHIDIIRSTGGKRFYNLKKFLEGQNEKTDTEEEKYTFKHKICYARVSTRGQQNDLKRQIKYLKHKFPDHELISDIGGGLSFKRRGFRKMVEYAYRGEIEEIVVAHKDRLCRFGYELVEQIVEAGGGRIVVLNNNHSTPEEEVVQDLLSIITSFSARVNGLRKYKTKISEDKSVPKRKAKKNT